MKMANVNIAHNKQTLKSQKETSKGTQSNLKSICKGLNILKGRLFFVCLLYHTKSKKKKSLLQIAIAKIDKK